jgi:hypothetical protein
MRDRIIDYMLGASNHAEAAAVLEHLARCEGCRQYLRDLRSQSSGLAELGKEIATDMASRQDRVIQALETVSPAEGAAPRTLPIFGGFARIAVAAVLVLAAGVVVGRLTAPRPVDAERLRADLEASTVASLTPAIQESVLAGLDERLETALATKVRLEVAGQIKQDLQSFAAQVASNSEKSMDERFAELIEVIEAARLTDRRQVARALEQIKAQTGAGLRSVAALTAGVPKSSDSGPDAENL